MSPKRSKRFRPDLPQEGSGAKECKRCGASHFDKDFITKKGWASPFCSSCRLIHVLSTKFPSPPTI